MSSSVELHLTYKIANAPLNGFPFPHLYIRDAFPADYYARMQAMMGLRTFGNPSVVPAGKQPVNVPYLLWSPGADGIFGPPDDVTMMTGDAQLIDRAVRKCDDVSNVPLPQ